jgi:transposase
MENIALIGIDLGKNSFHIHCQDHRGKAVYRKKFTRPKLIEFLATCPATTIAMEACGGSHFMARKLAELGHFPKLISPQFVRPFVKSNKNDFVDAEAICEAASRPSMRFVQPRTESQQAMRALHRVRESLVQDKVKTTNQMHAFLLEFGISVPRGAAVISRLSTLLEDSSLPLYLSQLLLKLQQHYHYLVEQIKDLESQLKRKLDEDEVGQRLLSIPCVGTLTASTISTEIGDGKQYASSRDFAAATGLVPRQYSTGGRTTLLGLASGATKRSELCWFNVPGYSYKNWNTSLANWPIGSGIVVPEKQLCRHLCSGKQAGQNSLGTDGATANLRSIKAEIHQFKQSFIWFCEY